MRSLRITVGNHNIALGNVPAIISRRATTISTLAMSVLLAKSKTIRIGTQGAHTNTFIAGIRGVTVVAGAAVFVNESGQLGTVPSSQRFKDEIKSMDQASDAILALKPVTFRYKKEIDAEQPAVRSRGRGGGKGESRSGGQRRRRKAYSSLRGGERDVAQ